MSTIVQPASSRGVILGVKVEKATGTLTNASGVQLFTVTGVNYITSMVGLVTTAITVANSYGLIFDPTLGTSYTIATAADLGSTDTAAGELLPVEFDGTALAVANKAQVNMGLYVTTGHIEHDSTGTDGAITWYLTYVPISDGASIVPV